MKIILCSSSPTIRERWHSMLAGKGYSIYVAVSVVMLASHIQKGETYLLLVQNTFADPADIGELCKNQQCKVLLLSDAPNVKEGMHYLQLGTVGYVNTYIAPNRLIEAVRTIQEGGAWFEYHILNRFIQAISRGTGQQAGDVFNAMPDTLTQREKEIAVLVSQGFTNNDIAEKLYISERTVKAHLGTIFSKTGTQNRLQLALLVLNVRH